MKRILAASIIVAALAACGGSNKTATTDTPSSSAPAVTGGVGLASGFCGINADLEATSNAFSSSSFDPTNKASIKTTFEKIRDTANRAVGLAPNEIKADVQIIADGFSVFVDELAKVDFDFTNPGAQSAAKKLDDPKFKAAGTRIEAYGTAHCKK